MRLGGCEAMDVCRFYRYDGQAPIRQRVALDERFRAEIWRPSALQPVPPQAPWKNFAVWYAFDRLRIFANGDYSIALVWDGRTVVHRSCVFPRYFRFPFMRRDDLQIGDTWTAESARGKGLATDAVAEIVSKLSRPGRRFWYVTEESNMPSVKVIERAGFTLMALGERRTWHGVKLFGTYEITQTDGEWSRTT